MVGECAGKDYRVLLSLSFSDNYLVKFFFLLFFISSSLFAGNCGTVNLLTIPDSPFNKIPVLDQNGSNICYAFTATQMIDFHLMKNGAKKRAVHPVWSALSSHNRGFGAGALSASRTDFSVEGIRQKGNCSRDYILKALSKWAKIAGTNEAKFLDILDKLTWQIQKDGGKQKLGINGVKKIFFDTTKNACLQNPLWDALSPHLMSLAVINSERILLDLVIPQCKTNKAMLNFPKIQYQNASLYRAMNIEYIEQMLNKNQSPIAIGFCSSVLKNPKYQGLLPPQNGQQRIKPDCGNHAILLIGKKKIGNACHFLLRNSWGSGFSQGNKNYQCICRNKKTNQMIDGCTEKTHNNGQWAVDSCWVPTASLMHNIYSMSQIPPK